MIIIGLTGSLGTGKSTVARMFSRHGAKIFDADKIAHRLIQPGQPCFQRIVRHFGAEIIRRGRIDRKKLAAKVFSDKKQLKLLEEIIHPLVIKEIKRALALLRAKKHIEAAIVDVPLLFESGLSKITDFNVTVWLPVGVQLQRLRRTSHMTRQEILRRIRAQMPLRQKVTLSDYIIDNRGTLTETRKQINAIWKERINKARLIKNRI